jgi:hypothetical protein
LFGRLQSNDNTPAIEAKTKNIRKIVFFAIKAKVKKNVKRKYKDKNKERKREKILSSITKDMMNDKILK